MLEKIKNKTLAFFKADTREQKLDIIMDHLIESIEIKGNIVHIKTNKDLIIENNGNTINIAKGYNIQVADKIHLNPDFKFDVDDTDSINNIKEIADESERKAHFKLLETLPDILD